MRILLRSAGKNCVYGDSSNIATNAAAAAAAAGGGGGCRDGGAGEGGPVRFRICSRPWGDWWVQVCRFIADIPVLPRLEFGTDSRY